MAKGIYIGNSNAKKVSKLYFGNGTSHKVKKGYIGVGNVAKLFYSSGYVWKKYNTTTTNTYYWNRFNLVSTTAYTWDKYEYNFIGYGYSYHRGDVLYLSINQTTKLYRSITVNDAGDIEFVGSYTYYRDFSDRGDYSSANGWYLQYGPVVCEIYDAQSYQRVDAYRIEVDRESKYEKGSYLGTVTSTSSSAYPNNGQQGSYWYQNRRSSTDYSKGTANGSVNSTNRSAYPDDGRSGNYWYEYNRQDTSYSQGSYIQDVENDNPNAYPSNGRHTDGYWYVKQNE